MLVYHSEAITRAIIMSSRNFSKKFPASAIKSSRNSARARYFSRGKILFTIGGLLLTLLYFSLAVLGAYSDSFVGFCLSFAVFYFSAVFCLLGNTYMSKQLQCVQNSENTDVAFVEGELRRISLVSLLLATFITFLVTN